MLKKTVTYYDFDDNKQTEDLYFNFTRSELIDLETEYEGGFQKMLENISKSKKPKEMIGIFRTMIRKAYGVRSEDGKRFIKSEQQSLEFEQTAAYDEFFNTLLTDTDFAVTFVNGIMPKALMEAKDSEGKTVAERARERSQAMLQDYNQSQSSSTPQLETVPDIPTVTEEAPPVQTVADVLPPDQKPSLEAVQNVLTPVVDPMRAELNEVRPPQEDFNNLTREELEERLRRQTQQ